MSDSIPNALLGTLLERWREVADAYKNDPPCDDLDRTYNDYRHIYLRNIRDLRHVIDTGQMPCSLMSDEERRRGDCGRIHRDEDDKGGQTGTAADQFTDPWASKPDVTAQVPEPVRRVLVEYLAAALLSKGDAHGVGQTITFALKYAGADLTGDIEKQISSITLGPDPADPPF